MSYILTFNTYMHILLFNYIRIIYQIFNIRIYDANNEIRR